MEIEGRKFYFDAPEALEYFLRTWYKKENYEGKRLFAKPFIALLFLCISF